jgi:hypothetical protein
MLPLPRSPIGDDYWEGVPHSLNLADEHACHNNHEALCGAGAGGMVPRVAPPRLELLPLLVSQQCWSYSVVLFNLSYGEEEVSSLLTGSGSPNVARSLLAASDCVAKQ